MSINEIMKELAQYKRLQEETAAIIEGLTDQIKAYMIENQLDTITGDEHKATYKTVTSSRIDKGFARCGYSLHQNHRNTPFYICIKNSP